MKKRLKHVSLLIFLVLLTLFVPLSAFGEGTVNVSITVEAGYVNHAGQIVYEQDENGVYNMLAEKLIPGSGNNGFKVIVNNISGLHHFTGFISEIGADNSLGTKIEIFSSIVESTVGALTGSGAVMEIPQSSSFIPQPAKKYFVTVEFYNEANELVAQNEGITIQTTKVTKIAVGNTSGRAGDVVEIPVTLTDNTGIACFALDITYDSSRLQYYDIVNGTIASALGSKLVINENYMGTGNTIRIAAAESFDFCFEGNIVTIQFKLKQTVPTSSEAININIHTLKDKNGNDVPYTKSDGIIHISQFIYGDADGSGTVDVYDAVATLRHAAGLNVLTETKLLAADSNRNGNADVFDAVNILRYAAGLSNIITALNTPHATIPTGLVVNSSGAGKLEISWNSNPEIQSIINYVVAIQNSDHVETLYYSSANTLNLTGLPADTYQIRVKATNANGESAYTPFMAQPVIGVPIPSAPTGLTINYSPKGTLNIFWTANPARQAVTKYIVSIKPNNGSESLYDIASGLSLNLRDLLGDTYTIKVKAVNAAGASAYSTPISRYVIADYYVFVKSVSTTISMGGATYTMTVADALGATRTYTLDLQAGGDPNGYLGGVTNCSGWTTTIGSSYNDIVILNKVVNISLSSESKIKKIENFSNTTSTALSYNAANKTFCVGGAPVATLDTKSVIYHYNYSLKQLTTYDMNSLPGFTVASGTYLVEDGKLKVLHVTSIGHSTESVVKRGVVISYMANIGLAPGKVRYIVTAIINGSHETQLMTEEESVGGIMNIELNAVKGGKKYVDFVFDADGETVKSLFAADVRAGQVLLDHTSGWNTGVIKASNNGIYTFTGVNISYGKLIGTDGSAVDFTVGANADLYELSTVPANLASVIPAPSVQNYGHASTANLEPMTADHVRVIVFHTNENNVIDTAFIYQNIPVELTILDMSVTVSGIKVASMKNGAITYTWTAIQNAQEYLVYYVVNGVMQAYIRTLKNSVTITGLANADVISVDIRAVSGEAMSSTAGSLITVTPSAVTIPLGLSAAPTANAGEINVSWAVNNVSQKVTKYVVIATSSAGIETVAETTADINTGIVPNTLLLKGLTGDTYMVRVKAVNAFGESAYSAQTAGVIVALAAPALKITATTTSSITLGWNIVPGATGYVINWTKGNVAQEAVVISGGAITSYTFTELIYEQAVTFNIRATGAEITTESEISATIYSCAVGVPDKPTTPANNASGPNQLKVIWATAPNQGVTKYIVAVVRNNVSSIYEVAATADNTTFTLLGLTTGDICSITVQAVNIIGTSIASDEFVYEIT